MVELRVHPFGQAQSGTVPFFRCTTFLTLPTASDRAFDRNANNGISACTIGLLTPQQGRSQGRIVRADGALTFGGRRRRIFLQFQGTGDAPLPGQEILRRARWRKSGYRGEMQIHYSR